MTDYGPGDIADVRTQPCETSMRNRRHLKRNDMESSPFLSRVLCFFVTVVVAGSNPGCGRKKSEHLLVKINSILECM